MYECVKCGAHIHTSALVIIIAISRVVPPSTQGSIGGLTEVLTSSVSPRAGTYFIAILTYLQQTCSRDSALSVGCRMYSFPSLYMIRRPAMSHSISYRYCQCYPHCCPSIYFCRKVGGETWCANHRPERAYSSISKFYRAKY